MDSDGAISLRQAIASSSSISFANNGAPCDKLVAASHIDIAGELFPKSTPTRFRKLDVKSPSVPNDFYTLEVLYLVWRLKEASAAEYSKQARENGVLITSAVGVTARRAVLEWLEGKVGDGDYIRSATGALYVDAHEANANKVQALRAAHHLARRSSQASSLRPPLGSMRRIHLRVPRSEDTYRTRTTLRR